ncbi:hypothetical protein [Streptomyces sp. NPDC056291]|uniref:hypothetical protein n=1 Tax=Streptomyces sp. NPDC056291 TaxID=3345772 RepID=UPI0035D6898A
MGMREDHDATQQPFDVADAAPLLLDAHAAVTSWTSDAARLLGYPTSEAVGRPAAELLIPRRRRAYPSWLGGAARTPDGPGC